MLKTLREIKDSAMIDIIGVCPDSLEFLQKLNDVTERLMNRGDWSGLIVPIHVCIYSGCVVWPRYVQQVRKINLCNCPMDASNMWYSFQSNQCGCRTHCTAIDYGRTSVFSDIAGEGRLVRAYARCLKDLGKTVTLFGIDNNGQMLMTRDSLGNWTPGIVLTLEKPFASTSVYVRRIDRVLKDETQCVVDLYAYDVANDVLENLAHYEPTDINPDFSRSQINAGCCNGLRSVSALVKLKFIPAKVDTDLVLINNRAALAKMVQSVAYEKEGDIGKADAYEMGAIRELQRELSNDFPLDQIPIQSFSSHGIGRQRLF